MNSSQSYFVHELTFKKKFYQVHEKIMIAGPLLRPHNKRGEIVLSSSDSIEPLLRHGWNSPGRSP